MNSTSGALAGLERTSLRQRALLALRRAISTGELAPGTHLVETDLSEKLGISRGTLREAMRQLQQEGIISTNAKGGLAVRTLDTEEIVHLFAVRAALESLAAESLAARPDRDSAVAVLREAVQAMVDNQDAEVGERIEVDLTFHRELCRLSGNTVLLRSWEGLEGAIRMSVMWAGRDRAVANMAVGPHVEIVDIIASGEAQKAHEFVRSHMDEAAANLVS
ncbi:DNA-binding GntR family transcriptional regulator [Prauserella sediminis]|uniref:DNA-binding GntR family transcriptional regulator n=1 Tax=Prauserella sediminis TaxID=577680 RepID=A0A839XV94_9PSEU|nr:GntR family transcriptional regulator [Prauserella sediminis]MBB3664463.1 DNA-binding GntR family transcriptional regulator [Prauserella sediminis]